MCWQWFQSSQSWETHSDFLPVSKTTGNWKKQKQKQNKTPQKIKLKEEKAKERDGFSHSNKVRDGIAWPLPETPALIFCTEITAPITPYSYLPSSSEKTARSLTMLSIRSMGELVLPESGTHLRLSRSGVGSKNLHF